MYPSLGIIDSYGLFLALAFCAALFVFEFYFRYSLHYGEAQIFPLEMLALAAVVLGMAGAYLAQNLYDFIEDPAHYHWTWDATFFGGLIFGAFAYLALYGLFLRSHPLEELKQSCVIAPGAISLAHALGRIGCFLNGCCYGEDSEAWYALYFPNLGRKVLPLQLWEALFLFAMALVCLLLAFRHHSLWGIPLYGMGYGLWRFVIEYFRGDHRGVLVAGLSPSQFWAILLFALGVGSLIFLIKHRRLARAKIQKQA